MVQHSVVLPIQHLGVKIFNEEMEFIIDLNFLIWSRFALKPRKCYPYLDHHIDLLFPLQIF